MNEQQKTTTDILSVLGASSVSDDQALCEANPGGLPSKEALEELSKELHQIRNEIEKNNRETS